MNCHRGQLPADGWTGAGWAAGLWACVLILAGCQPPSPPAPQELAFFFTCDNRGRLVPCGCFTGQYGGMTRLKSVLDMYATTNDLRLDIGDAIGGIEDYHQLEYRQILKAFGLMRYDAINLGWREARLPAPALADLIRASPVPVLSANLLDKSTGKPLAQPWLPVRRGACRIALVGVLDPRGLTDELGEGLVLEPMETALARLLPVIRPKADCIVLLAFTDEDSLARLAREFYELDLILGGRVRQPAQQVRRENRALVDFTTNESRALGLLKVRWQKRAPLEPVVHDIVLLKDTIPESLEIQALATAYRQAVRHTSINLDKPERLQQDHIPGVRPAARYVGSENCLSCHPSAGRVWENSAHARAFATLQKKGADADPKCLPCHTLGFGTASGYQRVFQGARLVNVGCENCHGPGSLHIRQRQGDASISFKFRPLGAPDCQQCHYGEFSRPFDWESFWPPIAHGAEPSPKTETAVQPPAPGKERRP